MALIKDVGSVLFVFVLAGCFVAVVPQSCQSTGLIEDTSDSKCQRYYWCVQYPWGLVPLGPYTCSVGTLFHWVANLCAHETNVYCGNEPCDDGTGNPIANGNYEDPDNCRKFFMCSNGIGYNMDCAAGTIYNPTSGNCDIHDYGQPCP